MLQRPRAIKHACGAPGEEDAPRFRATRCECVVRVPGGVERTRNRAQGNSSRPDTSRYVGDLDDGPCRAVINRGVPGWSRSPACYSSTVAQQNPRGRRAAAPVINRGAPGLPVPRARRRCALDAGRGALIHTLIHDSGLRPGRRLETAMARGGLSLQISTFRRRGSCAFTLRSQPARNSLTSSARPHGSGCPATSPWRCAPPRGPLPVPFPQLAQPWRGAA